MIHLFKSRKNLQQEWKQKTIDYAQAVNAFVDKGMRDGWDNAGPEPEEAGREKLVPHLLRELRKANSEGNIASFRNDWPLAHGPLIPELEKNGQSISDVAILDDGRIIARIGETCNPGYVVEIDDLAVNIVEGIEFFGKCPHKRYFAYTRASGVSITDGWLGEEVAFCPYPTGLEGTPSGFAVQALESPPRPTRLVPFPDGSKVLFVSPDGIFVLTPDEATRLLPTEEAMRDHFSWLQESYPEDELQLSLDMEHGAVSPCGNYIATGSQDSTHLIYDSNYQLVGDIGHLSEYPHYAVFSKNGEWLAFNSCHFYNGITIGVPTRLLPGITTEAYEENDITPVLEDGARVYAGVHRKDEFILGDASGYLRAVGEDGTPRWRHFIGSSVGDIDISADESTLVCTTYAGFLSIIKLDNGGSAPYEIGDGGHTETRRWLFWKNEKQPLAW